MLTSDAGTTVHVASDAGELKVCDEPSVNEDESSTDPAAACDEATDGQ